MTVIERADETDLGPVLALLERLGLPPDGLSEHVGTMFVARDGDALVGSAALEVYEHGALLRSVAVAPERQGHGVGRSLVDAALDLARSLQLPAVFLLTTTAEGYFSGMGFQGIDRALVPPTVRGSVEFTSACPQSAAVMRTLL